MDVDGVHDSQNGDWDVFVSWLSHFADIQNRDQLSEEACMSLNDDNISINYNWICKGDDNFLKNRFVATTVDKDKLT